MTETTARLRPSAMHAMVTVARSGWQATCRPKTQSWVGSDPSGLLPPPDAVSRRVLKDAAVEVEDLPLHPVRLSRAEPGDEVRYLGRRAERAERRRAGDLVEEVLPPLRVLQIERHGVGVDVARVHRVHRDAARTELDGEVARERLERRLRRREDSVARHVPVRVHA